MHLASKHDERNEMKYDRHTLRFLKGDKAIVAAYANSQGKSLNGYIIDLIEKDMKPAKGADFSLTSKDTTEE